MTSLQIIGPNEHVTAYLIKSNRIENIYQLIESIKFHTKDINTNILSIFAKFLS